MKNIPFTVLDALLFQGLWWSAALWRDQALVVMIGLLLVRHYFSVQRSAERMLALTLAPLGWFLMDGLLVMCGVIDFNSTQTLPLWMLLLWIGLVWSFMSSLQWLQYQTWWIISLAGGIGGGLSYYAAAQLEVLVINHSIVWVVLMWMIILPLLFMSLRLLLRSALHEISQ